MCVACNLCFGTVENFDPYFEESLMQWNWVSRWHILKEKGEIYSCSLEKKKSFRFLWENFLVSKKTFLFASVRMQKRCFIFETNFPPVFTLKCLFKDAENLFMYFSRFLSFRRSFSLFFCFFSNRVKNVFNVNNFEDTFIYPSIRNRRRETFM